MVTRARSGSRAPRQRRLGGVSEQRDFVDGVVTAYMPGGVESAHKQRMDHGDAGGGEPLLEALLGKLVHEEADGAAVHAVDRLARIHEALQGPEHEAVAAERD